MLDEIKVKIVHYYSLNFLDIETLFKDFVCYVNQTYWILLVLILNDYKQNFNYIKTANIITSLNLIIEFKNKKICLDFLILKLVKNQKKNCNKIQLKERKQCNFLFFLDICPKVDIVLLN